MQDRSATFAYSYIGMGGVTLGNAWVEYLESIDREQRLRLLNEFSVSVRGFRKGTKNIPDPLVLQVLKDIPRRCKKKFRNWFESEYGQLLHEVSDCPVDQIGDMGRSWLEQYPINIVKLAFLVSGRKDTTDAVERFESVIQDNGQQTTGQANSETQRKIHSLEERLSLLEQRLHELETENKSLQSQNKKLHNESIHMQNKINKKQKEHEEKLNKERERAVTWQQKYEERVAEIKQKDDETDRVVRLLRETEQDLIAKSRRIDELEKDLQSSVSEAEELRRVLYVYQVLNQTSENIEGKKASSVLVVGVDLPRVQVKIDGATYVLEGIVDCQKERELAERCKAHERIVMLSLCNHRLRIQLNRLCGTKLREVPSIYQLRDALVDERGLIS